MISKERDIYNSTIQFSTRFTIRRNNNHNKKTIKKRAKWKYFVNFVVKVYRKDVTHVI